MTENLKNLWLTLFGTTELLGVNIGFWVSMAVVFLLVVLMNVIFWSFKQKEKNDEKRK